MRFTRSWPQAGGVCPAYEGTESFHFGAVPQRADVSQGANGLDLGAKLFRLGGDCS